jgi:hypothetical protein
MELEISRVLKQTEKAFQSLQQRLPQSSAWQRERVQLQQELTALQEASLIYYRYFQELYESRDRFWMGYRTGAQCYKFLYDAAYIPVGAVRTALSIGMKQATLSPYLLGIRLGWKLSAIQEKLERLLENSQSAPPSIKKVS